MDDYSTISHDSDSLPSAKRSPRGVPAVVEPGLVSSKDQTLQYVSMSPRVVVSDLDKKGEPPDMPLRVTPKKLVFNALEPGVLYAMTFAIQNATRTAHRVRISYPHTSCFALNYIPSGALAPGLDLRAEIECQLPESISESSFTDKIVVSMGPHKVEVPIFACKPGPDIVFNPSLNFGLIVENVATTKRLAFKNRGVERGTVSIEFPDTTCFRAIPDTFELEPEREQIIQFKAKSDILGPIREIATVHIEGLLDPMSIDLSAQVVVQDVSLVSTAKGGIIDNLDLGYLFYGEIRETDALLINNGPSQLAYSVLFEDDENQRQSGDQGETSSSRCVTILPPEGVLGPYSQHAVSIRYCPKVPEYVKGFSVAYNKELREPQTVAARPIIEIPETGQRIEVNIQGAPCLPNYSLTPKILRFGKCPVYDRRDILVTFTNKSNAKMNLEFGEVAHFKMKPSKFVVQGGQAKTFVASFVPTQMGKFKNVFHLDIEGGISREEIRVIGETDGSGTRRTLIGGPETLPTDFKRPYKFVDPKEVAAQRYAEVNALSENNILENKTSTKLAMETESTSVDPLYEEMSTLAETFEGVDVTAHMKKVQHRKIYNDFLQTSYTKRIQKRHILSKKKMIASCGYDRSDPFGKDMGMERGLEEPDMKLPEFSEPLWLANRNDEGDGTRRIIFDENRLISKKFSANPVNQSDIRDCASDVSFAEMKMVACSHKILNFGRVSVNSVNVKNFAVCNTLQRCIQVQLSGIDHELAQTKPISQIVPVGQIAGFDVSFTTREVGKYHGSFSWMANGCNITKVAVVADVVPLELNVDRKVVKMAFSESSLETFVEEDLVLSNPGNASAEFLWGSTDCFACTPERGLVEAGQSAMVKITWTPKHNASNEADLALHVIGGNEQIVKVIGDLQPGNCQFKEKAIAFGSVAVGSDYTFNCHIRNVGSSPTVYAFDEIPEKLGIRIEPDRGVVEAESVVTVTIHLSPTSTVSYEKEKIVLGAQIRGGKSISLKLTGESIMPQLILEEKGSYDFGEVAVGSEVVLPMSIKNVGSITSNATLDLRNYPEFYVCIVKDYDVSQVDKVVREDHTSLADYYGNTLHQIKENEDTDENMIKRPRVWNMTIKAGQTMHAGLVFKPQRASNSKFLLPLSIQGIRDNKAFHREVNFIGCASRIKLSSHVVDFGDRVVSREATSRMSFFQEVQLTNIAVGCTYEIRELEDPTSSCSDEKGFGDIASTEEAVFFISPLKGDLSAGGTVPIRITFMPASNTSYYKCLGIFISGQNNVSTPYQTIHCAGSGVYPKLTFSVTDIVLPVVPLKVTSRYEFYVHNNGYDVLVLKHRVSPTIPVHVDVTFPDGVELGYNIQKLRVVVSFKSDVAISWSGKLEFFDDDGEKFPLEISGCTDGCILTNSNFVTSYRDNYGFMGLDEQPVYFLSKAEMLVQKQIEAKKKEAARKQRALERQKAADPNGKSSTTESSISGKKNDREISPPPPPVIDNSKEGVDVERPACCFNDASRMEVRCLLKWINKFACKKSFDYEDFPYCLMNSQADILVDCIETLSGRKIPGLSASSSSSKSGGAVPVPGKRPVDNGWCILLQRYKDLILFLVKSGAMLNHINPAFLLDKDQHLSAMEVDLKRMEGDRVTPSVLKAKAALWEQQWDERCCSAWSDVLFQVVKVFVLSRISYNSYKNTPGVITFDIDGGPDRDKKGSKETKKKKASKFPSDLKASNVYSHSEAVLLMWAAYHMGNACKLGDEGNEASKKMRTGNRRLTDPETDLGDWFYLCQVVHSHVPEFTKLHKPLHSYTAHDRSRKDETFRFLKSAMESLHMDFDASADELSASPRSIFLLLVHFYLNLPCLIPKSSLEFKGRLGDSIAKVIELKNPSKRKIAYRVQLEGDKDFSIEEKHVYLDPESTYDFTVSLLPRFSRPTNGTITFWGVRENGLAGTNMVFKLSSNIVGRKPVEVTRKTMTLYEVETFHLNFLNPYEKECTFHVQVDTKYSASSVGALTGKMKGKATILAANRNRMKTISSGVEDERSQEDLEVEDIFHEPLWSMDEKFTIPYDGVKPMIVNATPFKLGTYTCQVVLIDATYGEFCQEVIIDVILPKPEKFEFQCMQSSGDVVRKVLRISSKNTNFEKAVAFVIESRLPAAKRGKARVTLQNLIASKSYEDSGLSEFKVDVQSPYLKCDNTIPFISEYIAMESANNAGSPSKISGNSTKKVSKVSKTFLEANDVLKEGDKNNSLFISFYPERAGIYNSNIIVSSMSNEYDIRTIDMKTIVTATDEKPTLEFRGPARSKIVQEIPIVNESEIDWSLVAMTSGQSFSGPNKLNVPKGGKEYYQLTFNAPNVGTFEGSLCLQEPVNGDSFNYNLLGVAEEPLAEDRLYFKCKARKREVCKIPVKFESPNASSQKAPTKGISKGSMEPPTNARRVFLEVQTDLPHVSGSPSFEIAGSGEYEVVVFSPVGGLMSGSITFTDPTSGAIVWYTVDIEIVSPEAEGVIEVESMVRKAASMEISLENPTQDEIVFDVEIKGDGLLGDSTYVLKAGDSGMPYELLFSPLVAGNSNGSVRFMNKDVGEFWYNVLLHAVPAPSIELPCIECMLGDVKSTQISIENPLSQPVALEAKLSDSEHFFVKPDIVSIGPYAQAHVEICYRPSSLGDVDSCLISLSDGAFGEIKYEISGKGMMPGMMAPVYISAQVKEMGSHSIPFKNPFSHPLPIDIILMSEEDMGLESTGGEMHTFSLITKKTKGTVIGPNSSFQVGISFKPVRLCQYKSFVQIRSNVSGLDLLWCYPIIGIAEMGPSQSLSRITTRCKTSYLREVEIPLEGLKLEDVDKLETFTINDFKVEVNVEDVRYKMSVDRFFRMQIMDLISLSDNQSTDYALKCRLLFEPLKTFATTIEIRIINATRGHWKLKVDVESTEQIPDDVVNLTASVGRSDKVSFRVSNRFLGYSPFQAYFSSKSSSQFSVSPSSGVLAPFGSEGTQFVVTFTPTQYGLAQRANLLIVTDDAQWSYDIRGGFPEHNVHNLDIQPKISTRR